LSGFARVVLVLLGIVGADAGRARAQDLDAGKSAERLFAANCAGCHRSPRGLAKNTNRVSLFFFLREHYTASQSSASELAAFLVARSEPPAAAKRSTAKTSTAATPPQPAISLWEALTGGGRKAPATKRGKAGKSRSTAAPRPPANVPSR
jgi:hypothetical protein